jgi:hypothetical protein
MCEKCKGEGIRTPLGHSAQASKAPLEFKCGIMKLSIGAVQDLGMSLKIPGLLTPSLCFFLCPENSKKYPRNSNVEGMGS